ncbi:hypothetical protein [Massilia sp. TWR1-2-2]|uniref:hypothetical protein n=1 Tax=Massilia sp. TWR1-2-2 TaxID=2804584 RepID=UPI003CEF312E
MLRFTGTATVFNLRPIASAPSAGILTWHFLLLVGVDPIEVQHTCSSIVQQAECIVVGAYDGLVMLPNESHAYRARESIMHMLNETNKLLEKYIKKAKP